MAKIKGITITLFEEKEIGTDALNAPVYKETPVQVENVLVYPNSTQEIVDRLSLYGKKAVYTLAIPKGDSHDWKNKKVSFFGQTFQTFGEPIEGIEENIPLDWNKKVMVAVYE